MSAGTIIALPFTKMSRLRVEVFGDAFGLQNVKSGGLDAFGPALLIQLRPRGVVWCFGLGRLGRVAGRRGRAPDAGTAGKTVGTA
jgi:ribosomal protein L1